MTGPSLSADDVPVVPPGNRFELVFEASGVVGKGTADSVPGQDSDGDQDQDGDKE